MLFTGGQGFIGSWVVERLLEEGAEIFLLDRAPADPSRFRVLGLQERCTFVEADLGDTASLTRALDRNAIRAVFHLAATATVGAATSSPLSTFEVNIRGTWNLLEACRVAAEPPDRVIVASTDKTYGVHEDLPYREDYALQPCYPYDVSKACADIIARSYAATFGLPVAVTRFANVFGGGDFNFSRLIPGTVQALLAGERPVIRSNGLMRRDFIYAEDVVTAYLAVADSLERPENHGRAWNASIGRPVTVLDVVQRLTELAGTGVTPEVRGTGTPHGELAAQWLDSTAISSQLGWEPSWDLEQGLEATYRWYAEALAPAR